MNTSQRFKWYPTLFRTNIRLLAVISAGALACTTASGFESKEHREMSDLAVAVVLGMAKDGNRVTASAEAIRELEAYQQHYGQITACVDYFMMPEKMIDYGWRLPTKTLSNNTATTSKTSGVPSLQYPISNELIERCDSKSLAIIQATHNNHAHFQQDLMMAMRLWHVTAIATAKNESNVYGGLFINSIVDHYLQDFFAPGHIATARDRLTDMPATATHDLANEMGAYFRPTLSPSSSPGALRVLEYLCTAKAGSFSTENAVASDTATCNPSPEISSLLSNGGKSIHLQAGDLAADTLHLRNNKPILLRGDDHLAQKVLSKQRTLMLAVQAASILDILEGTNSFSDFHFSYDIQRAFPQAQTAFGRYDFGHAGSNISETLSIGKDSTPPLNMIDPVNKYLTPTRFTPCSLRGCQENFYRLGTRSPIFSISLQRESHVHQARRQRSLVSIEGSTDAWMWNAGKFSGGFLDGVELTPSYGYAYYHENGFRGNGPFARFTASIPETEFSVSSYVRWLSYQQSGSTLRRASFGLRADVGFSSYFTLFISGGTDHVMTSNGPLSKGFILGAGVQIGAPLTRLNALR